MLLHILLINQNLRHSEGNVHSKYFKIRDRRMFFVFRSLICEQIKVRNHLNYDPVTCLHKCVSNQNFLIVFRYCFESDCYILSVKSFSIQNRSLALRRKMKIFQLIQSYYELMGISSWQQSTKKHSLSKRALFGFILLELCIVSHFLYMFYVANGYMEYVECISTTSGSIITFVCFATIAIKSDILFKIIDNIEGFIVNS